MAITRIGQGTGTNTATLPALQVDDLIVVCAYRDGSATPPTVPAAFSSGVITTGGGSTNSMVVAALEVTTGSEVVGTWTGATSLIAVVYRGVDLTAPGGSTKFGSSNTTVNYSGLMVQDATGGNCLVAFGGHRSTNTAIETPPTGFSLVTSVLDASDELACFERFGSPVGYNSIGSVVVGGTSSGYRTSVFEMLPLAGAGPTEYTQSASIASGSSVLSGLATGISMSLVSSAVASKLMGVGKRPAVPGLSAVSRSLASSRTVSIASSGALMAIKSTSLRLAIAGTSVVTAAASRAYLMTLAISSSASVIDRQSIGKTSSITSGALVTAGKAMSKAFGMASAGSASVRKASGKVSAIASASAVATQKAVNAQMAVPAASAVSAVKSLSASLSVATAGVVSASKTIGAVIGFVSIVAVYSLADALINAGSYLSSKFSRGLALIDVHASGSVEASGVDEGTASPKQNAGFGVVFSRAVAGIIKRKR